MEHKEHLKNMKEAMGMMSDAMNMMEDMIHEMSKGMHMDEGEYMTMSKEDRDEYDHNEVMSRKMGRRKPY